MNADPLDVLLALPDGPDRIARVITEYVAELRAEVDRWRAEAETLRKERDEAIVLLRELDANDCTVTFLWVSKAGQFIRRCRERVSVLEAELRTAKEKP